MARVRAAASDFFKKHFSAGDRAAIDTLTGKHSLDFTTDRDQLDAAVAQLRWGTVAAHGGMTCPDVSYYIADLVVNKADAQALAALTYYTAGCAHVRPELAREIAWSASNREIMLGREDTRHTLAALLPVGGGRMTGGSGLRRSADPDRLRDVVRAFLGHFGDDTRSRLQVGNLRLLVLPREFSLIAELYVDIAFNRFDC